MKKVFVLLLTVVFFALCSFSTLAAEDGEVTDTTVEDEISVEDELVDERYLMDTPFDEYTVTEGYLCLIFVMLVLVVIVNIAKGAFSSW